MLHRTVTPTELGRLFERETRKCLEKYRIQFNKIHGKAGDEGVDLWGTWKLPTRDLQVMVQCKNTKSPISPSTMREWCGTKPTVDGLRILASRKLPSKAAFHDFQRSEYPMAVMTLENSQLTGFILNQHAMNLIPELNIVKSVTNSYLFWNDIELSQTFKCL
jgi:hypothetical protein